MSELVGVLVVAFMGLVAPLIYLFKLFGHDGDDPSDDSGLDILI